MPAFQRVVRYNSQFRRQSSLIVSRWPILVSAETALEQHLDKNPAHPFQVLYTDEETNEAVFGYSRRIPYFYFAAVGCIASCLGLIIWLIVGGDKVAI